LKQLSPEDLSLKEVPPEYFNETFKLNRNVFLVNSNE
jgi:hypothetical protein